MESKVKFNAPGIDPKILVGLGAIALYFLLGKSKKYKFSPVSKSAITRVGQGIMQNRGNGSPHSGVDIFAPAGTSVISVTDVTVLRVTDGRGEKQGSGLQRAGLFVDTVDSDGKVFRYLHLGSADVKKGQKLSAGDKIGEIAKTGTSGLGTAPSHLHFEIRSSDWSGSDYGKPIDPIQAVL